MRGELTVRVQSLDGTWETLGAEKARGIVPEGVSYDHDSWGSRQASFTLKRDTGVPWPDVSAFTPVDIYRGGLKVWSGRVSQTPVSDSAASRQIGVECEGWQYHLDDDSYEGKYVHTAIGEWQNARSFPTADLTKFLNAPAVETGNGGIVTVTWTATQTIKTNTYAGILLDLGPYNTAASISVDWDSSNNSALMSMYGRVASDPASITSASDTFGPVLNNSAATGTSHGIAPTAARYVGLLFWNNSGADQTPTADVWFRIRGIRVFTNDGYRSTDASVLTSDMVIKDALTRAPLLSTDTSQISTGAFTIPVYAPDGFRTVREHINAVNAYDNYNVSVDVDARLVFAPKPSAPVIEVGAWSGGAFDDASTNNAADIYNRVLIEGTGPDGSLLRQERTAGQQSGATLDAISTPAPNNPSFASNATSWTNVTRDTTAGNFYTAPAGGAIGLPGATATETFTGTFKKGVTYVLTFAYRVADDRWDVIATLGVHGGDQASATFTPLTTFAIYSVAWTPTADRTGVTLTTSGSSATSAWIDSLTLYQAKPTLVDRRGFTRSMILQVGSSMTAAGGNQIGDKFLANHRTTPLKGSISATGPTTVRAVLGGHSVHPSQLGLLTNQLIRLSQRIDFDTGAQGKDGTLVAVSYDEDTEKASLQVDADRHNFEAMLARLAIVTSQVQ